MYKVTSIFSDAWGQFDVVITVCDNANQAQSARLQAYERAIDGITVEIFIDRVA